MSVEYLSISISSGGKEGTLPFEELFDLPLLSNGILLYP